MGMEEQMALKMWTDGLGDMNKFLRGESPLPKKKERATKDSWKTLSMPKERIKATTDITLSEDLLEVLKLGHIPEVMEDHWFMYYEDDVIRYYRSWTGFCVFEGHVSKHKDGYIIDTLYINHNPQQYYEKDPEASITLFVILLITELGGYPKDLWQKYTELVCK